MARAWLLISAAALVPVPASAANLISNGSFETPVVPSQFTNYVVGSSALTGWTIVGPAGQSLSQVRSDFSGNPPFMFPAQDGTQWIDLTGFNVNGPVGVAQTVATTPGQTYDVSFWVGNVSGGIFGTQSTVQVELSQGGDGSCTNTTPGLTLSWQHCNLLFTAAGPSTTITFRNGDPASDNSNGLDNISVDIAAAAVPEPAGWALLIAGFALAGAAVRRREMRAALGG